MRPIELSLRNFRSYSGEHKFDFRDRRLIAIVGPTGAGKSTILDAITFALYGSTPRTGMKNFASLINQREAEAMVRLRFEAAGGEWEATRSIRRKGGNQYALSRHDANSAEPVEKWVMAGQVDNKVKELLGLDYDAFTRSVLLAQGKFAEFLEAGPAKRDEVLKGLFGFERLDKIKDLAKEREKDAQLEIAKLDLKLQKIVQTQSECEELEELIQVARTRCEQLSQALPESQELNKRKEKINSATADCRKKLETVEDLNLPEKKESEKVILAAEQATAKMEKASTRLKDASHAVKEADQIVKSSEFQQRADSCREADLLIASLKGLKAAVVRANEEATKALRQRDDADEQMEQRRSELESAQDRALQAERQKQETETLLEQARADLLDARHRDMAAELRSGLEAGGDCPVCEQPVHEIPRAVTGSGVAEAEKAVKQAKADDEEAASELKTATGIKLAAKARLEGAQANLESSRTQAEDKVGAQAEAQKEMEECLGKFAGLLGEGDPEKLLAKERAAIQDIQDKAISARAVQQKALDAQEKARVVGETAKLEVGKIWINLVGLAASLEMKAPGTGDDLPAIRSLLNDVRQEHDRSISLLKAQIQEGQTSLKDVNTQLQALLVKHEVKDSIETEITKVEAQKQIWSNQLKGKKEQVAGGEQLEKLKQIEQTKQENFNRLSKDLVNTGFIKFLLDTERMALSEIGSLYFQRLSSDRYRFSEDGKFDVIDLNFAGQTRRSDTLSGGETFLASLGLALALAEMVGREGGRLDAFMLDEGFGTLDPEHLDLAMEGVERLVADSDRRLVMVVSHVAELRERVDDLLILEKDPATGDTKIVEGAGSA